MADATKAQSDKDLDRFFIEDPNDLPAEDDTQEEEQFAEEEAPEEADTEPEDGGAGDAEEQPDKFKGKTFDDLKKAYTNLEAMMGKQAQELGELRKAVTKTDPPANKQWTAADIPVMPDGDLDAAIARHEEYLLIPDQALTDAENFPTITVQYNRLMAEKAKREAIKANKSATLTVSNAAVVNSYHGKDALTADELKQIEQFALTRLSDNGEITKDDLDVAMHKLFPGKWAVLNIDKEKKRIAEAKTQVTKRIIPDNAGSGNKALKTLDELKKMSEVEYDRYLDTLSPAELKALQERINRG